MLAKLYKLTDTNGQTRGGTQWGPSVTHKATGETGRDLCSDGWIHAYEHPLLAVLLNPIHANFAEPRLWEAEGKIGKRDGQLKCGCRSLKTTQEISLPKVTTTQRVAFAIYCGLAVCKDEKWVAWANGWLSGRDRSEAAWAAEAWAAEAAAAARAAEAADINLIELAEKAMEVK